ncbi:MAG: hypothetical protein V1753_06325 [Pseudomonadota bacterium]
MEEYKTEDYASREVREVYPYSLRTAMYESPSGNIFDSNMFSAYVPAELSVPRIEDPRKVQALLDGQERHPAYIRSAQINQVFNYIGFIKRSENQRYREYLPSLFQVLSQFLKVLEEIVYTMDMAIPNEVYQEQKKGLENFIASYQGRFHHEIEWIEKIWKQQKLYLEQIDMLVETLSVRRQLFDFSDSSLYSAVVGLCKKRFEVRSVPGFSDIDIKLVANCCVKAAMDGVSKTIWSGDIDIVRILRIIYEDPKVSTEFPQIYLRASYDPFHYKQMFP